MTKRIIYCDMDGVLCNFEKRFKELTGIDFNEYVEKNTWTKTWKIVENDGIRFWSDLEWMKDGKKLWDFIKGLNVQILTGSPYYKVGEYAKIGKEIWVDRELGNVKVNHIPGKLKYKYIENNDILIDDSKRNCDIWENNGGIAILHIDTKNTIKELIKLL